jgi:hypothetical protein
MGGRLESASGQARRGAAAAQRAMGLRACGNPALLVQLGRWCSWRRRSEQDR